MPWCPTPVLEFQVASQSSRPHPDRGRPEMQSSRPRLEIGVRSFPTYLWVVELLGQRAPDHGQQVPTSRAAPEGSCLTRWARPAPRFGSRQPAATAARLPAEVSPAPPGSSPAGRRLLRDVRSHAGVPAHCQGQTGPEAPDPVQPLAEFPHLGDQRERAELQHAHPPARRPPTPVSPLALPATPPPLTNRGRLLPAAIVGRSSSAPTVQSRPTSSGEAGGAGARRARAGAFGGPPHS